MCAKFNHQAAFQHSVCVDCNFTIRPLYSPLALMLLSETPSFFFIKIGGALTKIFSPKLVLLFWRFITTQKTILFNFLNFQFNLKQEFYNSASFFSIHNSAKKLHCKITTNLRCKCSKLKRS